MQDRRTFLAFAAALLPAGAIAQTPAASPRPPRELARHTLTGPLDGFDVVLIELTPGPGTGRDHRHTGPVLGYVVDGQVRFGVNHGPEQIVPAGARSSNPLERCTRRLDRRTRIPRRVSWRSWSYRKAAPERSRRDKVLEVLEVLRFWRAPRTLRTPRTLFIARRS